MTRDRGRGRYFAASALAIALVSGACGPAGPDPTLAAPEDFTIAIPATAFELEMVGVPGEVREDGTRIEPYWLAKTEMVWEGFDPWRLAEDLPEEERPYAIDAQSRPTRPYGAPDRGFGHDGYAVISISAHTAEEYLKWLCEESGRKWRLPTITEWRRACVAGGNHLAGPAPADGGEPPVHTLEEVAWYFEIANDRTHPVGEKAPNAWGFHDMLGNAGEWCKSDAGDTYYLCGGSYDDDAEDIGPDFKLEKTSAWNARDPQIPQSVWWLSDGPFCGFRPLCEVEKKTEE